MSRGTGRSHRRALPVVGVMTGLAIVMTACTASDERRNTRTTKIQATSDPQPPIGPLRPGEPCPVTKAMDTAEVPANLAQAASGTGWYGENSLWVGLPSGEGLGKFPFVTMEDGQFTSEYGRPGVRATRLDGPGRARASSGGYATEVTQEPREPLQFWPTGIDVSGPGCWKVTSSAGGTTIEFVVDVRRRPTA